MTWRKVACSAVLALFALGTGVESPLSGSAAAASVLHDDANPQPLFTYRLPITPISLLFAPSYPVDGFGGLPWQTRIVEGGSNWPLLGRPLVNFGQGGPHPLWDDVRENPCFGVEQGMPNGIHMAEVVGARGIVFACPDHPNDLITQFQMTINSNTNWHVLNSTPTPAGLNDLEAVGAHEFGHAMGFFMFTGDFDHWNQAPLLNPIQPAVNCNVNSDAQQTMCVVNPTRNHFSRTPSTHDIHTMCEGYEDAPWNPGGNWCPP